MFFPEGQIRVHLYGRPCDMRKSFDGHGRHRGQHPREAKRLERGRFIGNWQEVSSREMDWTALKLLLEGIEPRRVSRRFSLQKSA